MGAIRMSLVFEVIDKKAVIALPNTLLDSTAVQDLVQVLADAEHWQDEGVVLDCSNLEILNSQAISALVYAQQKLGKNNVSLVFQSLSGVPKRIFHCLLLDSFFTLAETKDTTDLGDLI